MSSPARALAISSSRSSALPSVGPARLADYGHLAVETMPRAFIFRLHDKFADKPRTANYRVQVGRLLMTYAVDRGWRDDNPALRPKQLRTGPDHQPWEEWQIAAFRKHWATGTLERVAFELLLNTGQRGQNGRGWQQVADLPLGRELTEALLIFPLAPEMKSPIDQAAAVNCDVGLVSLDWIR